MIFKSVVVKVTNNCNFNCSYCYVFNKGDRSYAREPAKMSKDIAYALISRVKQHCLKHNIDRFLFIFHGGEPLLMEESFYTYFVEQARIQLQSVAVGFALQTNGSLLTEAKCSFLNNLNIQVGISLDGPPDFNAFRVFRTTGMPAYDAIIKGASKVKENCSYGLRVLSVINTKCSPCQIYTYFKELNAKSVSFLFPDTNHDRKEDDVSLVGNWLIELFDIWFFDKEKLEIQPFRNIILKILGHESVGNEVVGLTFNSVLNIRTDGGIEAVDSLKICKDGITHTDYNVVTHEIDDVVGEELINKYYFAHKENVLHQNCCECEYLVVCGGGQLAHRYSEIDGFDNPSIYCNEMKLIIGHIQKRLYQKLPALKERINLQELS